jgi:hypothetical protein
VRSRAIICPLLVLLVSCSHPGPHGGSLTAPGSRLPSTSPHARLPSSDNRAPIALIVMENHEFSSIAGSRAAPYINGTLIPVGRLFTQYTAVSHPSLPNYLALTSGSVQDKSGTDAIAAGEIDAPNLFSQLSRSGTSWAAFQETMPSSCYAGTSAGSSPGMYALKHDPAMAYVDVATMPLCRNVVPLSRMNPEILPSFSFVTPNQCHDMHSCSVQVGDAWLRGHIPPLLRVGATVIITFDEGDSSIGGGGHVLTIEAGPGIPAGSIDASSRNHYSLLAGLEDYFGVSRLGMARAAIPLPL